MKIFGLELNSQSSEYVPTEVPRMTQEQFASAFKGARTNELQMPGGENAEKQELLNRTKNYLNELVADVETIIPTVPDFEKPMWLQRKADLEKVMAEVEAGDIQAGRVEIANTMMDITRFLNTMRRYREELELHLRDFPEGKMARLYNLLVNGKRIIEAIDPDMNKRNRGREWAELIPEFMLPYLTGGKVTSEVINEAISKGQLASGFLGMLEELLVLNIRSSDLPPLHLQSLYDFYLQEARQARNLPPQS